MDSTPEADVLRGVRPPDVETICVLEDPRVSVRRAEEQRDRLASGNRRARDLDAVLEHPPFEELQRRIEADELLDRCLRRHLALDEPPPLGRVVEERRHAVSERVDGRLVACVQEHDDGRDDLVVRQPAAVDARLDEPAHDVVARRPAALCDQVEHVSPELGRGLRCRLGLLLGRVELVHLHVPVRPVEQVAMAVGRNAEELADQRDRVRLREVVEEVEAAALETRVEQLACERLRRRAHRLDRARRERRRDELADACVLRRLDEQEAPALDVPERLPVRVE